MTRYRTKNKYGSKIHLWKLSMKRWLHGLNYLKCVLTQNGRYLLQWLDSICNFAMPILKCESVSRKGREVARRWGFLHRGFVKVPENERQCQNIVLQLGLHLCPASFITINIMLFPIDFSTLLTNVKLDQQLFLWFIWTGKQIFFSLKYGRGQVWPDSTLVSSFEMLSHFCTF